MTFISRYCTFPMRETLGGAQLDSLPNQIASLPTTMSVNHRPESSWFKGHAHPKPLRN